MQFTFYNYKEFVDAECRNGKLNRGCMNYEIQFIAPSKELSGARLSFSGSKAVSLKSLL